MPSIESVTGALSEDERNQLLALAKNSIRHGLQHATPLSIDPIAYSEALRQWRASFVTLLKQGALRGCIGHLEATRPVVLDVVENAFAAAFGDPRFPALAADEFPLLTIHISILSAAEPITFTSESELIEQLQPGVDGLILETGMQRGTFLPTVWSQLPDPKAFLRQLKLKAGLSANYWSEEIKVSRYTTETFS